MPISINTVPAIPPLPRIEDKTKINIRYSLIAPYANAHIYWEQKTRELVYDVEEPTLNENEAAVLERLQAAMLELININVVVERTNESLIEYIDKTARLLIGELNLKVNESGYEKLFYYLFRNFIGLNQIEPLLKDYFIEDIECNGVDTPVYIVHRIYRNIRTNIRFQTIEELASFVEKLSQRAGRHLSYAQPLLDGTLPDGSIDYQEPVIYREKGIVKINKIGEVIDKYYENDDIDKPVNAEGLEVASFDKNSFKIKWKKADYVYRHKLKEKEELYHLDLEFGRKVNLTGCHSVFAVDKEGVKSKRTDELKEGDYVVLPSKLPENNVISEINLAKELAASNRKKILFIKEVPDRIYLENKKELYNYYRQNYKNTNQTYYEHKNKKIIPIELYHLLADDEIRKCFIGTTSSHKVPCFLKVNRELARLLGYYIAEGWLYDYESYGVCFSLHKDELDIIEEIKESAKACFNLKSYVEPPEGNGIKVKIDGIILWLIMKEVLKVTQGAKNKRVPELLFNTGKELQAEFVRAWHAGDYSTTVSEGLANDVSYLALFNEDITAFYKSAPKKTFIRGREINTSGAYYSNFYARETLNTYPSMIPIEIFNPLKKTHMRLSNKRISRERLMRILRERRYERFENLGEAPAKFISEWEKRGLVSGNILTAEGMKLLEEIQIVKKLAESDFCFAKINKISKVKSTGKYVYDFSVNGNENFVGGTGGICCHNSRVNATYTKDVTSRGPTFTLRKFTKVPWTPVQLIALNTLSPEMLAYFWMLLQYKANIFIVGGTGSGKTTLLNALAFFIPPEARVVSIEDTRELSLPRENWVPAVARTSIGVGKVGEVDLFDLLRNSFRQNPDYVIVGEVRGREAFVLFQGMASGHPSMGTLHADSVDTMIRRLQTPPINLSPSLVNTLDCVAVISHAIVKKKSTRRLREIVEIINVNRDGGALINTPFTWNPSEDLFYFKKQSKVFEKISARYGIPIETLQNEFLIRSRLLYALYQKRIFGFEEVQSVINDYYVNPEMVLRNLGLAQ